MKKQIEIKGSLLKKVCLLCCIMVGLTVCSTFAQTKTVQYRTAEKTETQKSVASDYKVKMESLTSYVMLLDVDNTTSTYEINLSKFTTDLDRMKEIVRHLNKSNEANATLGDDRTTLIVEVDNRKMKHGDVTHLVLWQNGLR